VPQIHDPSAQVVLIAPVEFVERRVPRIDLGMNQRRAPLITRMPVEMDDSGVRKRRLHPGQAEIDFVELQDRCMWRAANQRGDVFAEPGIPRGAIHVQPALCELIAVDTRKVFHAVVFAPVVVDATMRRVRLRAAAGRIEPAALVERLVVRRAVRPMTEHVPQRRRSRPESSRDEDRRARCP